MRDFDKSNTFAVPTSSFTLFTVRGLSRQNQHVYV